MKNWRRILCFSLMITILSQFPLTESTQIPPYVKINIPDGTIVYEGDIINCTITGNPVEIYWIIDNQTPHYLFYNNNPVIYNPEPTPLNATYVNLTVYARNNHGSSSDTVRIILKRIYFGDIHFHSTISDGYHSIDTLYSNTIKDNYLDFACLTDHAEIINSLDFTPPQPLWMFTRSLIQFMLYKLGLRDEWSIIKQKAIEYYKPGRFTTLLGFEYSPGPWYPGGYPWSPNGHEDICHINFYYKDVYPDARKYSGWDCHTFDEVLGVMGKEREKGHLVVCFPHHPIMRIGRCFGAYTVNWSFLHDNIKNTTARDNLLRGAEVYSKWGTSIGRYSGIPIHWSYDPKNCVDSPEYWVEKALWEWSENTTKNRLFAIIASSDNHAVDRAGSASLQSRVSGGHPNPSGLIAVYSIHNTRPEIWDALNNCSMYGVQALKIRANIRFNNEMVIGRWINTTKQLHIRVTAYATFPGLDSSGRSMCPHGYPDDQLDNIIENIWVIKKDRTRGAPWCKIVAHTNPNSKLGVLEFNDWDVHPNDFYYIVIQQNGAKLGDRDSKYMAFLGPVFIDSTS
ncbi:MAG TPA: DUF3604 domain-containing protein [Thermoplasmatales archaeon]|nr:DUF3604 domain-containing protein [Thermoplasmatales archaeon]